MLIDYNSPCVRNGVLFADYLSRCKGALGRGDEFIEVMKERFQRVIYDHDLHPIAPKLRHIQEVDSAHDTYALLQVCDVLLGATLNGILKCHKGKRMAHKNAVTAGMQKVLELPSLMKAYWQSQVRIAQREYASNISMEDYRRATHFKYRLWFWRPK
jgi:hypothetical protein